MSQFSIDIDAEAVFLDGAWYTREDLSRRIRAMLDAGDFNVATPSLALQELMQTMGQVRTVTFRCTPDLTDALTQVSGRTGQPASALVREAVTQYITHALAAASPSAPRPVPVQSFTKPAQTSGETTVRVQHPSAAIETELDVLILAQTSTSQDDLPKVIVEEQPMVIAGPGALRAAGIEQPIELTNPKPARESPPDESEQRWFKQ